MILNIILKILEDLSMILVSCIHITKSTYAFKGLLQCQNNDFIGLYQGKMKQKPYYFELP